MQQSELAKPSPETTSTCTSGDDEVQSDADTVRLFKAAHTTTPLQVDWSVSFVTGLKHQVLAYLYMRTHRAGTLHHKLR